MKQTNRTVSVSEAYLGTVQDCVDLLEWSRSQDGLTVSVTGTVDGDIVVQCEGFTVPTVYAKLGDTVVWNGVDRFEVIEGGE